MTAELARTLWDYNPETGVFTWQVSPRGDIAIGSVAGTISVYGYRIIGYRGKKYRAARLAWLWMTGSFPTAEADHRDLDKANDAWGNLREATSSQQKCNMAVRVDNALAMKGVCATVSGFFAHITMEGQRKYLGHFATAAEAQAARAVAEIEMHGEFRHAA